MKRQLAAALILASLALNGCATPPREALSTSSVSALRAQLEKADLAMREARLVDAEGLYRDLANAHPRLPEVWLQLGNIYARQGQLEASMRAYKDGLEASPQDGRLWHNLALIELRQSIRTLETASELLPTDDPQRVRMEQLHRVLLVAGRPER